MYRGDGMDGAGGWWWIPMILMMLLVVGAVVALVLVALRRSTPAGSPTHGGPPLAAPASPGHLHPGAPASRLTPEEILADRLARGEIDPTDYQDRMAALRTARMSPP